MLLLEIDFSIIRNDTDGETLLEIETSSLLEMIRMERYYTKLRLNYHKK